MKSEEEIKQWVEQNANRLMPEANFSHEDLGHIAMCLEHILLWYYKGYPLGNFLTAVVRNDFLDACFRADDVNRKALYLYALFLANQIPADYRRKAIEELKTNKGG